MRRVRVLGRVEVGDADADRTLGGGQARELLAFLVARRHRPATTADVIDALWPTDPPATAPTIVHGLIRRLRQALGAGVVARTDAGYRLVLSADEVDLWTLDRVLAAGDLDAVRRAWQVPPFGAYADRPWAREAVEAFTSVVDLDHEIDPLLRARRRVPVTRLVGRRRELATVTAASRRSRLVTLVGLGGVGKTRLGLEVLRHLPHDQQAYVDIGAGVGPTAGRVATDLGLAPSGDPDRDLRGATSLIGRRSVLLLLDGCEHDPTGAARATEVLLGACPELTIIATSRRALGVPGEHVVPVLPFDSPGDPRGDAVELLLDRAQSMGLSVTIEDRERAAGICRRSAGVPLAIELGVAELVFGTGSTGVATETSSPAWPVGPERAVAEVVRQSIAHLSQPARRAATRAALLVAGFTPDLIAEIRPEGSAATAILHELIASGLVVAETSGTTRRFRFLDPVREALLAGLEEEDCTAVHRALITTFRAVRPELGGPPVRAALGRAVGELPNAQALLECLRDHDRVLDRLELVTVVSDTWAQDGQWAKGAGEIAAALALVCPEGHAVEDEAGRVPVDPLGWAEAVRGWTAATGTFDGHRRLVPHLVRAAAIARSAGALPLEAHLRLGLANGLGYDRRLDEARQEVARIHEIADLLDSEYARLGARGLEGNRLLVTGDPAGAREVLSDTVGGLEGLGAYAEAARVTRPLAMAHRALGDTAGAVAALEHAEQLALTAGARGTLATVRAHLADLRFELDDQRPEGYVAALDAVLAVGNLRAAGIVRTRLGQLTGDRAMIALGVLDLWDVDQPWAAASLATLLAMVPPAHPLHRAAPAAIAALASGWGTPLDPPEAELVEPHRAAHHGPPPDGWEAATQDLLRSLTRAS